MDPRDEEGLGRYLALVEGDSTQAQQSVIGSMLIDAGCVGGVVSALQEEDFLDQTCRNTFAAIKAQFLAGLPVDAVLIAEKMGGGGQWVQWARQVMEITPTSANVALYTEAVRQRAILARLRDQADRLIKARDLPEAVGLVRVMSGLITETGRGRTVTAAQLAAEFWERLKAKEKPEYLPWGFPGLEQALYAQLGDYIVLGGYPSAGKTLLSIQMALSQARRFRVVYYTLETRPEKMADRLFSHLAEVPLPAIKQHSLSQEQYGRTAQAMARFTGETPIDFVHASSFTADDIAADAISKNAQIVYIDYLQLLECGDPRANDYARVTRVSRTLKQLGQDHKIGVVALAQLARPEKTGKKGETAQVPPNMHSLRESGQIEQDADAVMLLWVGDERDNDNSNRVLKVGKNKEGRRKTVYLAFHGETQTMTETDPPPDRSVAAKLSAEGRAIRNGNRARQLEFWEIQGEDEENPF